jgi:hypothetical protein
MKRKSLHKKLTLNKNTIASLNDLELKTINGGVDAVSDDTEDILCNTELPGVCTCYDTCMTCDASGCATQNCAAAQKV